jgi:hypothetical protein
MPFSTSQSESKAQAFAISDSTSTNTNKIMVCAIQENIGGYSQRGAVLLMAVHNRLYLGLEYWM